MSVGETDSGGELIRELNQIPLATTSRSHRSRLSTISRDICLRCPDTSPIGRLHRSGQLGGSGRDVLEAVARRLLEDRRRPGATVEPAPGAGAAEESTD